MGKIQQIPPFWPIFSKFEVQISLWVRIVWKRPRYEKFLKILGLFKNFQKKGFWHPQHPQNPQPKFWNSNKCCFGAVGEMGPPPPPKIKFLRSPKTLEYFSYLGRFHTTRIQKVGGGVFYLKFQPFLVTYYYCPLIYIWLWLKRWGFFWRLFLAINISKSPFRMKMLKVCKVFKNFWSFRKFWKKGLFGPRTHPNPQIKILRKKWKFPFFQKFDLGV